MSLEKLIEAAKSFQPTEENVKEFYATLHKLNEEWEEKELKHRIWYNKLLNEPFAIM